MASGFLRPSAAWVTAYPQEKFASSHSTTRTSSPGSPASRECLLHALDPKARHGDRPVVAGQEEHVAVPEADEVTGELVGALFQDLS